MFTYRKDQDGCEILIVSPTSSLHPSIPSFQCLFSAYHVSGTDLGSKCPKIRVSSALKCLNVQ